MSITTSTVEIDGNRYEITQLGARDGRKMLVRLTQVFGPVLGELIGGEAHGSSDGVSKALMALSTTLTEEDMDYVCSMFGRHTEWRDGQRTILLDDAQQDLHFAGRYDTMTRWIFECMKINFSPFFGMLQSASGMDGFGTKAKAKKDPPGYRTG
jgi:hypothetical protein